MAVYDKERCTERRACAYLTLNTLRNLIESCGNKQFDYMLTKNIFLL